MSEVLQIIILFIIVVITIVFTKKISASKMIKASDSIINDLRSRGATSPETGVDLEYAHKELLKIGFRDYRPKTLQQLIIHNLIGVTEDNLYYLNESEIARRFNKEIGHD
jgi:hypothetical protein